MNKLGFVILLLLFTIACSSHHNNYSEFKNIPINGWIYGDTLTFLPEMPDSISYGDMLLAIRHNNNYAYRNLWLRLQYCNGDTTIVDTLNIELADTNSRWLGNGLGIDFQISNTIDSNFKLIKGNPIKLCHIMQLDTLRDIEQIGITFIEH